MKIQNLHLKQFFMNHVKPSQVAMIDLDNHDPDTALFIEGFNTADRLYLKHANGHKIFFKEGACLYTQRGVMIIDSKEKGLTIVGASSQLGHINGGIIVVGSLNHLRIEGLELVGGQFGLHMSQHHGTEQYGVIEISNCIIRNAEKEGVYIGKSDQSLSPPRTERLTVSNTLITMCGWDGLQFAGCDIAKVEKCQIYGNGLDDEPWQNFDITVNPKNNLVYFDNTPLYKTQILNSGKIFVN